MEESLPPSSSESTVEEDDEAKSYEDENNEERNRPIATWTYCKRCDKVITPLVYISENTWKFSFGKFLETLFYNRDAVMNAPQHQCSCQLQSSAVLYFGCGKLAAKFVYESVRPFSVFVRPRLPMDASFRQEETLGRLAAISRASTELFVKFDKQVVKVSREARSLLKSAVNRPEHLQTVISELNSIGSEVDHTAKALQEKIASVLDKCRRGDEEGLMLSFPWVARRHLYLITSAWNEKLSATGQAISSMRKLAAASSHRHDVIGPNVTAVVGDPNHDELVASMKRLNSVKEQYSRYNVADIDQVLPALPGSGDTQQDWDEEDEIEDFPDGVDADVLASRQRLKLSKPAVSQGERSPRQRPTKSLGTRRDAGSRSSQESLVSTSSKSTPGGAVKSAITRFFNRGGKSRDPYAVNLGIFAEGRPRLAPGVDGIVVPVADEQWSTIIAYSLASAEYAKQFKHFTASFDAETLGSTDKTNDGIGDELPNSSEGNPSSKKDELSDDNRNIERRMLVRNKSHIKHTFRDFDEEGQLTCKFVCTSYWATQFDAVRQAFLSEANGQGCDKVEQDYIESLSSAYSWAASGGKSGASFARTSDDRFVIKCISRTELQMFLDCAPAYFEYLSKAFFHGL